MICARPIGAAIFAVCLAFSSPIVAQEPVPTVADVFGHLQRQEFHEAESAARAILDAEPENARALALLGSALHAQERWDDALTAHLAASEFPSNVPRSHYQAACAHARLGHTEDALALLEAIAAAKSMDLTGALVDPDLESVVEHPRLIALLPSEADFADPFVEDVKVIHDFDGEGAGDQYGWIARSVADADGDGIDDLTTSAPTWGANGSNRGRVYTYSGRTGTLLWTAEGNDGDQFGLGIEAAGDVDGDGFGDVAAGGPFGERVVVYRGRDGKVLLELSGTEPGEFFGRRTSDVGDANDDGHDDVLVSAPANAKLGTGGGAAYLFSGADGSKLWSFHGEAGHGVGSAIAGATIDGTTWLVIGAPGAGHNGGGVTYVFTDLTQEPRFVIEPVDSSVRLGGMFVSMVGDVDADGTPDVYASDWADNAAAPGAGRVVVHSGDTGAQLLEFFGEAAGDGFGIGPADAGDLDGDGHDDLVVGAWQHGSAAPSGGKVYLYSGRDGSSLGTMTCKVMGDTFGFDATGVGDVDGDGQIDLLLTSAWSAVAGPRSGRMFVVSSGVQRED